MPRKLIKATDSNREVLKAISELAAAVGMRFDKVDNRFDIVEGRLNGMDKRFDKVDAKLEDLQSQIHRIETFILRNHQQRLETIERKLGIGR